MCFSICAPGIYFACILFLGKARLLLTTTFTSARVTPRSLPAALIHPYTSGISRHFPMSAGQLLWPYCWPLQYCGLTWIFCASSCLCVFSVCIAPDSLIWHHHCFNLEAVAVSFPWVLYLTVANTWQFYTQKYFIQRVQVSDNLPRASYHLSTWHQIPFLEHTSFTYTWITLSDPHFLGPRISSLSQCDVIITNFARLISHCHHTQVKVSWPVCLILILFPSTVSLVLCAVILKCTDILLFPFLALTLRPKLNLNTAFKFSGKPLHWSRISQISVTLHL